MTHDILPFRVCISPKLLILNIFILHINLMESPEYVLDHFWTSEICWLIGWEDCHYHMYEIRTWKTNASYPMELSIDKVLVTSYVFLLVFVLNDFVWVEKELEFVDISLPTILSLTLELSFMLSSFNYINLYILIVSKKM